MSGYTKLFNSILDSSVWDADCSTRILWITMLAMVNRDSHVLTTPVNLSLRARLPLDDVVNGLEQLLAADPQSRDAENNGRRIEKIDGGWKILNYEKYRGVRDRADYMRRYMRKYRSVNKNGKSELATVSHEKPNLANSISKGICLSPPTPPLQGGDCKLTGEEQAKPLARCAMPGCDKPTLNGNPFCSDACRDYAQYLVSKPHNPPKGNPS